jgi:shikimate dehydrogenase
MADAKSTLVFLIGMPGCGKTSLGRACAESLGVPFLDMDIEIEKQAGMPITQIFAEKGEAAFRDMETAWLRGEEHTTGSIISTGGGVILRGGNVRLMRGMGRILFIDRPLEALEASVAPGADRPLVQARSDLRTLYDARIELYRAAADITVTNQGSFAEVLTALRGQVAAV